MPDGNQTLVILAAVAVLVLFSVVVLIVKRYKRCPSDRILVIYGKVREGRSAKCLHGGGAFVWPLIQDYAFLSLEPLVIDIPLEGALSMLQATLTLPGIAGIVLTVGMAVDANVLIFERIREEVRNGRTPFNAVESGFKRAMTTILDANITTAVAAFLLFFLGSGPVKGFGATLAIGIVTSMFTAIMLTRMICVLWLRRSRPAQLPI